MDKKRRQQYAAHFQKMQNMKTKKELELLIATEENSNKVIVELAEHIEHMAERQRQLEAELKEIILWAKVKNRMMTYTTSQEQYERLKALVNYDPDAPQGNEETVPGEYWAGGIASNH